MTLAIAYTQIAWSISNKNNNFFLSVVITNNAAFEIKISRSWMLCAKVIYLHCTVVFQSESKSALHVLTIETIQSTSGVLRKA